MQSLPVSSVHHQGFSLLGTSTLRLSPVASSRTVRILTGENSVPDCCALATGTPPGLIDSCPCRPPWISPNVDPRACTACAPFLTTAAVCTCPLPDNHIQQPQPSHACCAPCCLYGWMLSRWLAVPMNITLFHGFDTLSFVDVRFRVYNKHPDNNNIANL